jgi:hypothetical protein
MKQTGIPKIESITAGASRCTPNSVQSVLRDLARLLEEYGPVWYTEAHYRRVQAALASESSRHSATVVGVTR